MDLLSTIAHTRDFFSIVTDSLRNGDSVRFAVRGWSMWPVLRDGDPVTVKPVQSLQPARGDILLFIRPSDQRLVLHRLVGFERHRSVLGNTSFLYRCSGDNCRGPAERIAPADVLGVASCLYRDGQSRDLHRLDRRCRGLLWQSLGPMRFGALRSALQRMWRLVRRIDHRPDRQS